MIRFLDDGRICLSNNAAERAFRGIAVGRHNWTFAGSDRGGERAAAIYTLIESCKLNDVDPRAWLADVLSRLPDHPPAVSPSCYPGTGHKAPLLWPLNCDRPYPGCPPDAYRRSWHIPSPAHPKRVEKPFKNIGLHPIAIAFEHRVPLAEHRGQIALGTSRSGDPKYGLQKQPAVHSRPTRIARFAQTVGFHLLPLAVRQAESIHGKLLPGA
jgi:transposase IS66-like protein/transposase IS66 family protein